MGGFYHKRVLYMNEHLTDKAEVTSDRKEVPKTVILHVTEKVTYRLEVPAELQGRSAEDLEHYFVGLNEPLADSKEFIVDARKCFIEENRERQINFVTTNAPNARGGAARGSLGARVQPAPSVLTNGVVSRPDRAAVLDW